MQNKLLSPSAQSAIISSGKTVYLGYLTLDFCNNTYYSNRDPSFHINGESGTFKDFIVSKIKSHPGVTSIGPEQFTLNGKNYWLKLTKAPETGTWSIEVTNDKNQPIAPPPFNALNEYQPDEFMDLIQSFPMTLHQEANGEYKIGLEVTVKDKKVEIGGPGKIDLYQIHINNLYAMLQHLSEPSTETLHMLIAMATGSGKSFTQALWFLVLYLSDCSAIFTTPTQQLTEQLKRDFSRLLPTSVTQNISLFKPNDKEASFAGEKPLFGIMTAENLLVNQWSSLGINEKPDRQDPLLPQDLLIFLDEEHETTALELLKERIQLLSHRAPLVFLSATPSQDAYKICDHQSVASLSSQEKEAMGIAKSAASQVFEAKALQPAAKNFAESCILTFVDAIEKHRSSAAHTYVDQSECTVTVRKKTDPFYVKTNAAQKVVEEKEIRRLLRWNIHCPIGDKALILASGHDAIVNLNNVFNNDRQSPYKNGNRVSRSNVYSFFQLGTNLDKRSFMEHQQAISHARQAQIIRYLEEEVPTLDATKSHIMIDEWMDFEIDVELLPNSKENIHNETLYVNQFQEQEGYENWIHVTKGNATSWIHRSDVTEDLFNRLKTISILTPEDKKQILHLAAKQGLITHVAKDTSDYLSHRVLHGIIENTLEFLTGFDSIQLDERRFDQLDNLTHLVIDKVKTIYQTQDPPTILKILSEKFITEGIPQSIATEIAQAMMEVMNKLADENLSKETKSLIVDNWHLDKKLHQFFKFSHPLASFTEKFKKIFLVNGLEKTATPIKSDTPFFNLHEEGHRLKDYEPAKKAPLKHNLSTMEALDDATEQKVYEPVYTDANGQSLTPAIVDTLFRKGLIGAYVTSERVCGFNDIHLDHVAMVITEDQDPLNAPNQIVQGFGRNRGLNGLRQPHFFLALEEEAHLTFSPESLKQKDYFPDLFDSRVLRNQQRIRGLKQQIAVKIKNWVELEIDPLGKVDDIAFQKHVNLVMLEAFDDIYDCVEHDFEAAKSILHQILNDTLIALNLEAQKLTEDEQLSFSVKIIACILDWISGIWYRLVSSDSRDEFVAKCESLKTKPDELPFERTYIHILENFNYAKFVELSIAGKSLINVLKEKADKTKAYLKNSVLTFLNPDLSEKLQDLIKHYWSPRLIKFIGTPDQQVALMALIEKRQDWLEFTSPYLVDLYEHANDKEKLSQIFLTIISKDSDVAQYLEENKIKLHENIDNTNQENQAWLSDIKDIFSDSYNAYFKQVLDYKAKQLISTQLENIFMNPEEGNIFFLLTEKELEFLEENRDTLNLENVTFGDLTLYECSTLEDATQIIRYLINQLLPNDELAQEWSTLELEEAPRVKHSIFESLHQISELAVSRELQAIKSTFVETIEALPGLHLVKFIKDNLQQIVQFLKPSDALFVLNHKEDFFIEEKINISEILRNFSEAPLESALPSLLRLFLPQKVIEQADADKLLNPIHYKTPDALKEIDAKIIKKLNGQQVIQLFRDSVGEFFDSEIYREAINGSIGLLEEIHLKALLEAIYPKENDYELCLMSELPDEDFEPAVVAGKIYLSSSEYCVRDPQGRVRIEPLPKDLAVLLKYPPEHFNIGELVKSAEFVEFKTRLLQHTKQQNYTNHTNAEKLKLLMAYKKDLANSTEGKQLFQTYINSENTADILNSDLVVIHRWIEKIFEEILDSLCYYECTTREGSGMLLKDLTFVAASSLKEGASPDKNKVSLEMKKKEDGSDVLLYRVHTFAKNFEITQADVVDNGCIPRIITLFQQGKLDEMENTDKRMLFDILSKRGHIRPIQPKLKEGREHDIWTHFSTTDDHFLTGIAKKIQFINGSKNALEQQLGKVKRSETYHLHTQLTQEAPAVLQAIQQGLNPHTFETKECTQHTLSYQFGQLFANGKSLSNEEIRSNEFTAKSGAEKIHVESIKQRLVLLG